VDGLAELGLLDFGAGRSPRTDITERLGISRSLQRALGDLSDDQVRRLAVDQRLFAGWLLVPGVFRYGEIT
jgi:hypothetical protein